MKAMSELGNTECRSTDSPCESPSHVRTSLAAAMTMGKIPGRFYRDARLHCINLLLTYDEGCHAKCAYCGLSSSRETGTDWSENSFIRVDWPIYSVVEIKEAIAGGSCHHVERACVSMITLDRAREDCITVVRELKEVMPQISVLLTPTIVNKDWLVRIKEAGADKVGIAVDAATPELFDKLRGKGVAGPHQWRRYWDIIRDSVEVFGRYNVGIHLIVGVGETEQEMLGTIQHAHNMGAMTHLFSFFPEAGSVMEDTPQPPIGMYRRVQMGRYIIDHDLGLYEDMTFNEQGQLLGFGLDDAEYANILTRAEAFMTSGCSGITVENACNRPFGNCTPFQAAHGQLRNFPFVPTSDDVCLIQKQLEDYSLTHNLKEAEHEFE